LRAAEKKGLPQYKPTICIDRLFTDGPPVEVQSPMSKIFVEKKQQTIVQRKLTTVRKPSQQIPSLQTLQKPITTMKQNSQRKLLHELSRGSDTLEGLINLEAATLKQD
jgi:hypothetical protein